MRDPRPNPEVSSACLGLWQERAAFGGGAEERQESGAVAFPRSPFTLRPSQHNPACELRPERPAQVMEWAGSCLCSRGEQLSEGRGLWREGRGRWEAWLGEGPVRTERPCLSGRSGGARRPWDGHPLTFRLEGEGGNGVAGGWH